MQLAAKPVMYSVPSNDLKRSRDFYSKILGVDLVRARTDQQEAYNATISEDGIDITAHGRINEHETPMMYFAVQDLDRTLSQAEELGSKIVWGPEHIADDVKTPLGRAAVLVDPGGSQVGLMELSSATQEHFRYIATTGEG